MKVLIMEIIRPLSANGCIIHRYELIKNLYKMGYKVYALTLHGTSIEGISIYPLNEGNKILFGLNYVYKILNLGRKQKFDFVLVRAPLPGLIAVLIKYLYNTKLIYEVNGISSDEYAVNSKYLQNQLSNTLLSILIPHIDIFVAKKADAIRAITPGIMNYLVDSGVDRKKIFVIGNGADSALFRPQKNEIIKNNLEKKYNIKYNEFVVTFIGNLAPWQGVEYLIQAAPLIINEIQNTKFLIIGDGLMKKELVELAERTGVSNNFIFTGTVPYEEVPNYINASDVCVAPFIRDRNEKIGLSPLKLFEYMACGKPVVASNIIGVGDILEREKAGIAVTPEKPKELAKFILKLLKDERLRDEMGRNGRDYVVKKHSWESVAIRLSEVCKKLQDEGYQINV